MLALEGGAFLSGEGAGLGHVLDSGSEVPVW